MHFMIPILQEPKIMEVRSKYQQIQSWSGTWDLQEVEIALRILFRPVEEKISEIINKIGMDYDQRVIPSIGQEVLKSVIA